MGNRRYDSDVGSYFVSVGDLLKRAIRTWALDILAGLFAIGWIFDAFIRSKGAPPMLEAILPYSGWLLLATILMAITVAYHQMRIERANGTPTNTHNYYGPTYNFPPGEEGVELYKKLAEVATVKSSAESKQSPEKSEVPSQDTDLGVGP